MTNKNILVIPPQAGKELSLFAFPSFMTMTLCASAIQLFNFLIQKIEYGIGYFNKKYTINYISYNENITNEKISLYYNNNNNNNNNNINYNNNNNINYIVSVVLMIWFIGLAIRTFLVEKIIKKIINHKMTIIGIIYSIIFFWLVLDIFTGDLIHLYILKESIKNIEIGLKSNIGGMDTNVDILSTSFIWLNGFIFPISHMSNWSNILYLKNYFVSIMLSLELILTDVFIVDNLISFYVAFESTLPLLFFLIGLYGASQKFRAGFYIFLYTLMGSLFMLLSFVKIGGDVGSTSFQTQSFNNFSTNLQIWLWIALFISFSVKTPIVPGHIWLPLAHSDANVSGSIILASVVLKLALYGFIRILIGILHFCTKLLNPFIMAICAISVIYSSVSTIRQFDLKVLVAYSSIAHMGSTILGAFSNSLYGIVGSVLFGLAHGFVSPALFILVGAVLYDRCGSRIINYYRGLSNITPIFSLFFLFFLFGNMGVPLTANFLGEFLSLLSAFQYSIIIVSLATLSVIFSAIYSIFLFNRITSGTISNYIKTIPDLFRREFIILLPLASFTLILGVYPYFITSQLEFGLSSYLMFSFIPVFYFNKTPFTYNKTYVSQYKEINNLNLNNNYINNNKLFMFSLLPVSTQQNIEYIINLYNEHIDHILYLSILFLIFISFKKLSVIYNFNNKKFKPLLLFYITMLFVPLIAVFIFNFTFDYQISHVKLIKFLLSLLASSLSIIISYKYFGIRSWVFLFSSISLLFNLFYIICYIFNIALNFPLYSLFIILFSYFYLDYFTLNIGIFNGINPINNNNINNNILLNDNNSDSDNNNNTIYFNDNNSDNENTNNTNNTNNNDNDNGNDSDSYSEDDNCSSYSIVTSNDNTPIFTDNDNNANNDNNTNNTNNDNNTNRPNNTNSENNNNHPGHSRNTSTASNVTGTTDRSDEANRVIYMLIDEYQDAKAEEKTSKKDAKEISNEVVSTGLSNAIQDLGIRRGNDTTPTPTPTPAPAPANVDGQPNAEAPAPAPQTSIKSLNDLEELSRKRKRDCDEATSIAKKIKTRLKEEFDTELSSDSDSESDTQNVNIPTIPSDSDNDTIMHNNSDSDSDDNNNRNDNNFRNYPANTNRTRRTMNRDDSLFMNPTRNNTQTSNVFRNTISSNNPRNVINNNISNATLNNINNNTNINNNINNTNRPNNPNNNNNN